MCIILKTSHIITLGFTNHSQLLWFHGRNFFTEPFSIGSDNSTLKENLLHDWVGCITIWSYNYQISYLCQCRFERHIKLINEYWTWFCCFIGVDQFIGYLELMNSSFTVNEKAEENFNCKISLYHKRSIKMMTSIHICIFINH